MSFANNVVINDIAVIDTGATVDTITFSQTGNTMVLLTADGTFNVEEIEVSL